MLNSPRRHFLPWDRPLLPQAVAFLAGDWTGAGPLDLSRTLVIVPTRHSGRRLREELAQVAGARRTAAFAPRVLTPEALVAPVAGNGTASRLEVLLAWIEVLRSTDLADFREVFPVDPPARNFAWAQRLGEQLSRVQATLRENALRLADVPGRVGADFPELARWQQLAALEQRHVAVLAERGLQPPAAVTAPSAVAGMADIDRIVLLATVDPLPALTTLLGAATAPVDVLVFAGPEDAGRFDPWGRPLPAAWNDRVIALPDFERRVHLCSTPTEQADRIAALAADYARAAGSPDGYLAVGIADPDVTPLLEGEARRLGVGVFNPEGRTRRNGALYHLLSALAAALRQPTFAAIEQLARCPDLLAYLGRRGGAGFSSARFLAALDDLRKKHLPADLADALRHAKPEVAPALVIIADLCGAGRHVPAALRAEPAAPTGESRPRSPRSAARHDFPATVSTVLAELFGARALQPGVDYDDRLRDEATAWMDVVRDCAAAAKAFKGIETGEWWELALRLFGDTRHVDDKPAGAVELQGWLELLFEDAPHLTVAGLNDGLVPEAVTEDAFLPESLRATLGLKTNAARFARDAFLLQAIAAVRSTAGRLDLLVGKTSASGDPLRPSRLLLRCPDAELPARVAFLFRAATSSESHLPWTRAWSLRPRQVPAPRQVAVTSLRRWLVCPFRFYLKYALRMEAVDAAKTEMDAFDFGTLCHAALEKMGGDALMRDCTDATVLREFLLRELTAAARAKFGAELPLPLVIQLESARQRLAKFAEIQARERAAGWAIQTVEQPFEVAFAGITVRGKIDRIDRHERTGAVRVLDYKTSDTAVSPREAHIRGRRADEALPEWAALLLDDKPRAWSDLQLPLYRHALAPTYGPHVALGYINLPKAVGLTTVSLWEDYTLALHASALACAEGVCAAVAAAHFWPPNEDIRADHDEFAALFHHGVAASVQWPSAPSASSAGRLSS